MQWVKVPSEPVLEALPLVMWRPQKGRTAATETAALMVYVALNFSSEIEQGSTLQIAAATYDELNTATGLSRQMLSRALCRLEELELIEPQGSHQQRRYLIKWKGEGRWFKLPCRAIVKQQKILPFHNFTLRSKYELHAMKLYLYLAARRRNELEYSMASYEIIHSRVGIPEVDIRKAISLLIGAGLLQSVHRESEVSLNKFGPNQYFFAGCGSLRGIDAIPESGP